MKLRYELDNSAIMHMAILRPGRANSFRMSVTLKEPVRPELLQKAVDTVAPRFPTIFAGIEGDLLRYYAVPVDRPPRVRKDEKTLVYMTPEEIRRCGVRFFYRDRTVHFECFHSLTDGYGGFAMLRTLFAEYFRLCYGEIHWDGTAILSPEDAPAPGEFEDGFVKYAGGEKADFRNTPSYLPGAEEPDHPMQTTVCTFNVEKVLSCARSHGVSMTAFLTAVMMESLMEMQLRNNRIAIRPVQIMVPADLRRLFPSRTLRNFSLYALPKMEREEMGAFEALAKRVAQQLKTQFAPERLRAMMTTNVSLNRIPVPLGLKCLALRIGYRFFGGRTSALSLSNLGPGPFPSPLAEHIDDVQVFLSPRITSPYNCGVISWGDRLNVCFSRCCEKPELEPIFLRRMEALGCNAEVK